MRVFSEQNCVVDKTDTVCKNILDICRKKTKEMGEEATTKTMDLGHDLGFCLSSDALVKMDLNLRDALQSYSHLHSHIAAIFISTGRVHLGQ